MFQNLSNHEIYFFNYYKFNQHKYYYFHRLKLYDDICHYFFIKVIIQQFY